VNGGSHSKCSLCHGTKRLDENKDPNRESKKRGMPTAFYLQHISAASLQGIIPCCCMSDNRASFANPSGMFKFERRLETARHTLWKLGPAMHRPSGAYTVE